MTPLSQWGMCVLFLYALAMGACLGLVYDVFRILRIAHMPRVMPKKRGVAVFLYVAVFLEDMAYTAIATVTFHLLLFNVNHGQFRHFALSGAVLGFALWYFTCGKLLIKCANAVIMAIRTAVKFVYRITLAPILRLLCSLCAFGIGKVSALLALCAVRYCEKSFLRRARQGFLQY